MAPVQRGKEGLKPNLLCTHQAMGLSMGLLLTHSHTTVKVGFSIQI